MARIHELRDKSKADLLSHLKDLKGDLAVLRVAQVTGGAPNKLSKTKLVRHTISQALTIMSQNKKRLLPLDLRPKKTRAMRRSLTKHQIFLKTDREKKREIHFPLRKYAIKV